MPEAGEGSQCGKAELQSSPLHSAILTAEKATMGPDHISFQLEVQSPKIWLVRGLVKFVPAVV